MLEFKLIYGSDGYNISKNLREKIFISEQGFLYDEDKKDAEAWHVVCIDNGNVIASARLYKKLNGIFSIGRLAVEKEYRNQYIGDTLIRILEDKTVSLSGHTIELCSIVNAVGFYEKQGYVKNGKTQYIDNILHFYMMKDLTKPSKKCTCCKNVPK